MCPLRNFRREPLALVCHARARLAKFRECDFLDTDGREADPIAHDPGARAEVLAERAFMCAARKPDRKRENSHEDLARLSVQQVLFQTAARAGSFTLHIPSKS